MTKRTLSSHSLATALPSVALFSLLALGCAANEAPPPKSPEPSHASPPANVDVETGEHLSPATIQAVMRESYEHLRTCYEAGLARNPSLSGRVTVRFVIDHSGKVKAAEIVEAGSDAGPPTDLPDEEVLDCLLAAYRGLEFPAIASGETTVVYPIVFQKEEAEAS